MEEITVTREPSTEPAWRLSDAIDTLAEGSCCGINCCAQHQIYMGIATGLAPDFDDSGADWGEAPQRDLLSYADDLAWPLGPRCVARPCFPMPNGIWSGSARPASQVLLGRQGAG